MKKQNSTAAKLAQKRAAKKSNAKKNKGKGGLQGQVVGRVGEWFEYEWEADPVEGRVWAFDIGKAQKYLAKAPASVFGNIPIKNLEDALSGYDVNADYALSENVDIDKPVIMTYLPEPWLEKGERVGVLIDGMHRVYKRRELGYDTVMTAFLPDVIAAQILLSEEELHRRRRILSYMP
ncbi:hypothetical protein ACFFLM_19060 [Deinococcus oregonensis]|uniref:Uncharacterized protein n=1 Tax=Deinococcus oregonensis TaxID=1805970 RepID=A0ABV6B5A2_9DEIO